MEEALKRIDLKWRNRIEPETCRWMWLACLTDAIDLAVRHKSRRELNWLRSDLYGVGSFRWVCEATGYDPQAVREKIEGLLHPNSAPPEAEALSA